MSYSQSLCMLSTQQHGGTVYPHSEKVLSSYPTEISVRSLHVPPVMCEFPLFSFPLQSMCVSFLSDNLKPIAAEERRIEEEEKKAREEQERIAKQLAEGSLFGLIHHASTCSNICMLLL